MSVEAGSGFSIEMPGSDGLRLVIGWLLLSLGSLVVGGLFTILIVLSRTPGVQEIFPWVNFFHTALVVHVDLTVLVWFLAFAGVLWSLNSNGRCALCGWTALSLAAAGAGIISLSPFFGAGDPLLNNYVPVLRSPGFFIGLAVFGAGFTLLVLRGLLFSCPVGNVMSGSGVLRFGLYTALLAALIAVLAVAASYLGMPDMAEGEFYYELLFWGGGHTIQVTHTQLMLVVWLWMATVCGVLEKFSARVVLIILALGVLPALLTPYIYYAYEVGSGYHLAGFTWLMQYGGGVAALPLALVITPGLLKKNRAFAGDDLRAQRSALLFSILLFGLGGIVGFLISGSNVTVPAHYHGSIVAVTLAFMGITYHLLPHLGFRRAVGKIVRAQPILYGSGQTLHVLGLAWSGGYGVQRKTAGTAQGLENMQEIAAMGMMGLGGLIAIAGGVLFLVVVFKAMWPRRAATG